MDITKRNSKMLKGVAILSMLMLHLFCRRENLPYTPLLWIGGTPLIYYFALFGDICVAVYCFVSGYAHYMQSSEAEIKKRWKHLLLFFIPFWVIAAVFSLIGLLTGNAEIPGSLTKFALNYLTYRIATTAHGGMPIPTYCWSLCSRFPENSQSAARRGW